MRRIRHGAALVVGLALVAGACAGDADGGSSGGGSPATNPAAHGPSSGCENPDPSFVTTTEGSMMFGGLQRVYNLTVPAGPADQPRPLVVNLHGALGNRFIQDDNTEWAVVGPAHGAVVVTPQAPGAKPIWDLRADGPDVPFIDALLDEIENGMCIDTDRVYLTGFSMGGMLSMVLACLQPERYAAVAIVAGMADVAGCDGDESVPLLVFHGTEDSSVGYDGVIDPRVSFFVGYESGPNVEELVSAWAERNGCEGSSTDQPVSGEVVHVVAACPSATGVELYRIEGGGHTWPGSEKTRLYAPEQYTTLDIEASELSWDFFSRFSRG